MSNSSGSSTAESDIDQSNVDALDNISILKACCKGVEPLEEPNIPECPTVKITQNPKFRYVIGIYQSLRASLSGHKAPAILAHGEAGRWLLVLAFTLKQCFSHYTAWKDRRDVLLDKTLVGTATYEDFISHYGVSNDGKQNFENYRVLRGETTAIKEVASHWLPSHSSIFFGGKVSIVRAVAWELSAMSSISIRLHKNFQAWHHRRELLEQAIKEIPFPENWEKELNDGNTVITNVTTHPLLLDQALLTKYLQESHGITFTEIDERKICNIVLSRMDSKNYHVWLHRSWFLRFFPFLIEKPSFYTLQNYYSFQGSENENKALQEAILKPDPHWLEDGCLTPTFPPCALQEELFFTAEKIKEDCLNNSAWCHRFFIFEKGVIEPLASECHAVIGVDSQENQKDAFLDVLKSLCLTEMNYALQWAFYEPGSESSFLHARKVAELYHFCFLRVYLIAHCREKEKINYIISDTGVFQWQGEEVALLQKGVLSWEVYLQSFEVLWLQVGFLKDCITPKVDTLLRQIYRLYSLLEQNEKAIKLEAVDKKWLDENVQIVREKASQFLLDNLHHVYAFQYHSIFTFLEQTWCVYLTPSDHSLVKTKRPSEYYATHGVSRKDLEESDSRNKESSIKEPVAYFLQKETDALYLSKILYSMDKVRSKYWENEIKIVMYREY